MKWSQAGAVLNSPFSFLLSPFPIANRTALLCAVIGVVRRHVQRILAVIKRKAQVFDDPRGATNHSRAVPTFRFVLMEDQKMINLNSTVNVNVNVNVSPNINSSMSISCRV